MNKDFQKFGLIIQGPFTSGFKVQKNHIYDCNESVKFILNNYSQYFDDIIISTWKSEEKKISINLKEYKNVRLLLLDDPGQPKLNSQEFSDNRLRQYFSSFKAAEQLEQKVDYIMKIRTDFIIDCKRSKNFFLEEIKRKKNLLGQKYKGLICGLEFWINRPYAIKDFIYIGTSSTIRNFFQAQVIFKNQRFVLDHNRDWPEGDSILKFLYKKKMIDKDKDLELFEEKYFFPFLPKKFDGSHQVFFDKELKLWQYAIKNYFTVLPHELRSTLEWKGKKFKDFHIKNFGDDYSNYIKAEENYISVLRENSMKSKHFYIINNSFFLFNPNFYKRKFENKFKKQNILVKLFILLIYINIKFRKILFYILIKKIVKKLFQK